MNVVHIHYELKCGMWDITSKKSKRVGKMPTQQKIPHLAAGDFYYLSTKLAALTELTSSRSNQECGVSYDVANSEVS